MEPLHKFNERRISFRGAELTIPRKLPHGLKADMRKVSKAQAAVDQVALTFGLLRNLLGDAQMEKVRQTVRGIDDPWMVELIGVVFEPADL